MPLGLGGCESFLRSASTSLGKVRSWRAVPKVKVFVLRVLHEANALQVRPSGRRAVRRLVSKLGGEGSWEASGKLDFRECESSRRHPAVGWLLHQ